MSKNNLYVGIVYTVAGLSFMMIALLWEFPNEAFLWGLGGAGTGAGLSMLWRYFYWSRPSKAEEYRLRLDNEQIELNDERKIMLRDKSGRITYVIMLGLFCLLCIFFSSLAVFGIMMPFSRYLTILFSLLLLFLFFCGIAVFRYLDKRL